MMIERLRESLRFWWQNLPAIALVVIPFSLLTSLSGVLAGPPLNTPENAPASINALSLSLIFLIRTLAEAALIGQLAAILSGRPRGLLACLLFALSVAPAMLLCNLIVLTGVSFATLLFILPGAWLYVRLSFAAFSVALERMSPIDALRSSMARTVGIQWELLAGWLMLLLAVLLISNLVGAVLIGMAGQHAGVSIVLDLITALGSALMLVLLFRYYDLNRTKEPA
jgi:hypothetical protein